MFHTHVILFVGLKTLDTFIKIWLVGAVSKLFNNNLNLQ